MKKYGKREASKLALTLCATLVVTSVAHAGPTGRYYVTDENSTAVDSVWQFQGNTLASFPTVPVNVRQGPILVDGNTNTVRAVAGGFVGGDSVNAGSEYNFAGTPGAALNLDFGAHTDYGRVVDAGFDGTNAYVVSGGGIFGPGLSGVFQYNADFSGPGVKLFDILGTDNEGARTSQGITFDTTTDTIWTSDYDNTANAQTNGGRVRQWSPTGTELFSFAVVDSAGNASERNTALAYDFSDDTFWLNAHVENTLGFGTGELWQFDRTGNFLQKIHGQQFSMNAPADILYWGGEIFATGAAAVPEPTTLGVLGAGLAALGFMRRKRSLISIGG